MEHIDRNAQIEFGKFNITATPQWEKEKEEFQKVLGSDWAALISEAYMLHDIEMLQELREIKSSQLTLFYTEDIAV